MKKIFILLNALLLLFCGCQKNPLWETEPSVLKGKTNIDSSTLSIDMSYEDFLSLIKEEQNTYSCCDAILFYDKNGYLVAVERDFNQQEICRVEIYQNDFSQITDADFDKISEGMTVFDVVETVGVPLGRFTSGLYSLDFQTSQKVRYRIYFNRKNMDDHRYYVNRTVKIE